MLPWMLRPCAPQLSRKQRSPASKLSKKPRPPVLALSRKPKLPVLWPPGMLRSGGPPSRVTLQATCQNHPRPGGTSHPRGRQEPNWLSLCLSGCPTHQPSRAQRHAGSFLSHFDGTGTHIPPIHLITRSLPREATICPSSSSCTSTWAVPQAQKVTSFPRPHGQHASWQNHVQGTSEGPLSSKWQEVPPWNKVLKQSYSEAFSWDTSLVKEARKEYFRRHSYNFTTEGTHNLSEVFRHMAESTKLLGSSIYKIQEVWKGPDELWQANYALRSLPKGLKFLHAVPPSESPKVMGMVGIHDLDALHCFNGLTHCPWCGKEGQNEGTVVNHLQMVHYRLGLVCDKCNNYPST